MQSTQNATHSRLLLGSTKKLANTGKATPIATPAASIVKISLLLVLVIRMTATRHPPSEQGNPAPY